MKKGKGITMLHRLTGLRYSILLLISIGGISFFVADGAGLKDAAAKAYLNFGAATDRPSSYSDILKTEFNMLVCENAMKWTGTENSQGKFTFSGGDQVYNFSASNGMKMRGHTFVWHAQTPQWVQSLNRDQMLKAMKTHIDSVGGHYKGKILEWDVVNEAVSAGASSFWQKTIGTGFIDSAFVYAHEADPDAYLYYNDYGGEGTGGKGDQIYNMVKDMKAKGIPIHGVGLQCHFSNSINKSSISANIKRLGELGLRVSCTEIDIANTSSNGTPWKELMEACLENYNATSFVPWGISDAASWRGSSCGCLIWDGQNKPKQPVYDALMSALNNANPTIAEKRRQFIGLTPSAILKGMGKPTALNYKAVQRATFNNNILSYYVPSDQNVRVQVMDARGKLAINMNLGKQTAGTHTVHCTSQHFPAGIYFAKINVGGQNSIVKIAKML